jgi:hypothetical protein
MFQLNGLWNGENAYYSATKGRGTCSSSARNRVKGAMTTRFCSCTLPSLRGLKRFDDMLEYSVDLRPS